MTKLRMASVAALIAITTGITSAFAGTTHPKPVQVSANALTRGALLSTLLKDLGVTPDKTGKNTFKDVSWQDWGYVHVAVEKGWVQPDSSTKFGVNDLATVPWVDQFYWNYCGITHSQYQPGGYPWTWANVYGLNRGLDPVANVTKHDLVQFGENLKALTQGWWYDKAAGVYHLSIPPKDEFQAWSLGTTKASVPSANQFQALMGYAVQELNKVTLRPEGREVLVTLPTFSDGSLYEYNVGTDKGDISYSFDGGHSWRTSSGFFSQLWTVGGKTWGDPNVSNTPIQVRVSLGTRFGISISNQSTYFKKNANFQAGAGVSLLFNNSSISEREI